MTKNHGPSIYIRPYVYHRWAYLRKIQYICLVSIGATVGTNKQLSVRLRRRKNRTWCSVVRCHALSPAFVRMTHHSLLSHGSYIKRPLPSDLCLLYFRAAPSFTSLNTLGTILTLLLCKKRFGRRVGWSRHGMNGYVCTTKKEPNL